MPERVTAPQTAGRAPRPLPPGSLDVAAPAGFPARRSDAPKSRPLVWRWNSSALKAVLGVPCCQVLGNEEPLSVNLAVEQQKESKRILLGNVKRPVKCLPGLAYHTK
jgi:hypothetical protein